MPLISLLELTFAMLGFAAWLAGVGWFLWLYAEFLRRIGGHPSVRLAEWLGTSLHRRQQAARKSASRSTTATSPGADPRREDQDGADCQESI